MKSLIEGTILCQMLGAKGEVRYLVMWMREGRGLLTAYEDME